jgi:dTDP-4-amino-4,6-dideoxygalactose transaminase
VRTATRDALAEFLGARGVATGKHYPEPVHLSRAYSSLGHARGTFPVAERLSREVLSLPLFPGMSDAQIEAVIDGTCAFFANA